MAEPVAAGPTPDRIAIRKKLFLHVSADHGDSRRTRNFVIIDKTPGDNRFIFDLFHIRRDAHNARRRHFDSVLVQIRAAAFSGADFRTRLAVGFKIFVFAPRYFFISAIGALKLLVGHSAGKCHSSDHKMVRAENFSNFFCDIRIQTADRSADDDDRRHADNHAEQSQNGAELVFEN